MLSDAQVCAHGRLGIVKIQCKCAPALCTNRHSIQEQHAERFFCNTPADPAESLRTDDMTLTSPHAHADLVEEPAIPVEETVEEPVDRALFLRVDEDIAGRRRNTLVTNNGTHAPEKEFRVCQPDIGIEEHEDLSASGVRAEIAPDRNVLRTPFGVFDEPVHPLPRE